MSSPSSPRTVLIVDDHPVVRRGLRALIDAEPDLMVCGEVSAEHEARAAIRTLAPDVVLVDISLAEGDGINLVRDAHAHHPTLPLLVLSMHDEAIYAERLLAVGAAGYVMKQAEPAQFLQALRTVLKGETYRSEALRQRQDAASSEPAGELVPLSTRELQVIGLIGRGISSREIADRLSVSVKTVESHRLAIKAKRHLATNAQLVQYAIQWHSSSASGTQ
jgi:DNA-binding NarL/FixJ family response regulator